jgi:eukaryotic-like serine/threonine-protein kinase
VTDQLKRLGSALSGRYTLERELGHGGMATVYLAEDLRHHRQVAIKVLRPELGSLLGPDRFTREIRIAAALNHPHILPLHDSGEADGLLFYVMPYVRGGSLRQKLSREQRLSIDEAVGIVRHVASALDHAHAHGLIHRDIKPENILLHEGEAMVTDFGIALAATTGPGERLTATGLMLGTPEYMSPEQAAGERALNARSDVYSLGCVLYELLAGEPPHTGATAQRVIARRFTEPAPSVRRLRPTVAPAVE